MSLRRRLLGPLYRRFDAYLESFLLTRHLVFGEHRDRVTLARTATVNNALFNVVSGRIVVGEHAFFGHNVVILTGPHDTEQFGDDRKKAMPRDGRDVIIEEGTWVGSNAVILGPCRLGRHCVVAPGSVVTRSVPDYCVVGGVPAERIRMIKRGAP